MAANAWRQGEQYRGRTCLISGYGSDLLLSPNRRVRCTLALMSNVTRVHVPGYLSFLVVVTLMCCLAIWYHYSGLRIPWNFSFSKRPRVLREAQIKCKVWTDKSTGLYYCPDSHLYGHTTSGEYLTQGEAIQKGYSPALHEPCQ